MAQSKHPVSSTPGTFSDQVGRACAQIGVQPAEAPPPDTRGRWRPHSEKVHGACAGILGRGGRFVAGLTFTDKDMKETGDRYQTLCGAEQALLDALRNVRAAKEGAKLTILDQSGQVLTTLTCQAQDPRTPAADKTALRALAAPAVGLITESTTAQVSKGRSTRGRNAAFRATIASLTSENQSLRQLEEAPAPVAPRLGRRRTTR